MVDAIVKITDVILEIGNLQTSIASAVEEQSATVAKIGRMASEAELDAMVSSFLGSARWMAQGRTLAANTDSTARSGSASPARRPETGREPKPECRGGIRSAGSPAGHQDFDHRVEPASPPVQLTMG